MRHIGLFLLLWGFLFPIMAQTVCVTHSRELDADRIENLGGRYGLLLLSKHKKLVVNVVNASKELEVIRPTAANAEGLYEYRVLVDADDTHQVKVEVNKMGDVYKTEFVANLKPDYMVAYRIEELIPIRMENQSRGNETVMDKTAAEVEFTSNLVNFKVNCSPNLQAKVTRKANPNDPNVTLVSVVFPVKPLLSLKERLLKLNQEYDLLTKRINEDLATDAEFERHDSVTFWREQAEAEFGRLSTLEIFADNTSRLALDISDLGPNSKKCYAVLPLVVEIPKTECSRYMDEGARLFDQRKYAAARESYVNALSTKEDVVPQMKLIVERYIAECDSCLKYEKGAAFSISKILEMKENGNATKNVVAKYASAGIGYLEAVNSYNPHNFYASRIESLDKLLADMPLSIGFTIVEWRTIAEGDVLPDVEIWAYYGTEVLSPVVLASVKKFKKLLDKAASNFRQVGLTDEQGRSLVELDRKQLPHGFVFCPIGTENIKMVYRSLDDLMRQATGTYLERQFRLKMYRRTNRYF